MSPVLTARPNLHALALAALALATSAPCFSQAPPPPPPLAPLGAPPVPAQNPQTAAKIALGQILFWEEQLSRTGTMACGSCHAPEAGGGDLRTVQSTLGSHHPGADGVLGTADDRIGSAGVPRHDAQGRYVHAGVFGMAPQVGSLQPISAVNSAYPNRLFWNGRAEGPFRDPVTQQVLIASGGALEIQALGPLVNDVEMAHVGGNLGDVQARLLAARPLALAASVPNALREFIDGRDYPALFDQVFGPGGISASRIAMALASYQRSLVANQTPHDLDLAGTPSLSALENQGRQVFQQAGCNRCHGGALLSDDGFHYIGAPAPTDEIGRMAVTGLAADRGRMRTPGLRNLALSAPYMADGRLPTLRAVVEFYNRGGDFNAPNKAPQITPLNLSAVQIDALIAFLGRPLTDPRAAAASGPFERPRLYSESTRVPQLVESAGSDPALRLIALEPPRAGRDDFTVALDGGPGFASARFLLDVQEPQSADAPSLQRLDATLGAQGSASVEIALPAQGELLYVRAFVADASAPSGWRASRSARLQLLEVQAEPALFASGFEP
jgi:cytochrome c peroxidase